MNKNETLRNLNISYASVFVCTRVLYLRAYVSV